MNGFGPFTQFMPQLTAAFGRQPAGPQGMDYAGTLQRYMQPAQQAGASWLQQMRQPQMGFLQMLQQRMPQQAMQRPQMPMQMPTPAPAPQGLQMSIDPSRLPQGIGGGVSLPMGGGVIDVIGNYMRNRGAAPTVGAEMRYQRPF